MWNGKKEDPLELYIMINDKRVVLLAATGTAVKFSSEKAIQTAINKLQSIVDIGTTSIDIRVKKAFKKSKFWKINEDCQTQIGAANGS